ncbi:thermonuclease family protein [Paenochrobactrum sp. BZR 588]|uniref:thermonuclease family protein n=1 Tax=unclassified Paenochrobactrum TaxID=2639760 RepID=UPI0038531D8C
MVASYQRAVPACLALFTGCVLAAVFIAPFYGALDPVVDDSNGGQSIIIEDFDYSELDHSAPQAPSGAKDNQIDILPDHEDAPEVIDQAFEAETTKTDSDASTAETKNLAYLVPDDEPMQMIYGAIAVAAGRLEGNSHIITLNDIVVTQVNEQCRGDNLVQWNCGIHARTAFRSWIGSKTLRCRLPENAGGKVDVTTDCVLGAENAAEWLVHNGWVKAAGGGAYANLGKEAENAKRGIWGNKPVSLMPELAPLPQSLIEPPSGVPAMNGERPAGYFPPVPKD